MNEITNSAGYRARSLQKRAPIPVFQDFPDKGLVPQTGVKTPSVYHDASSDVMYPPVSDSARDCSPSMGLREVSINLKRSSPLKDTPYHRSIRSVPRRKSSQARTRFNSEEYIEHIENELQTVKDAMYSPTTHIPWKEKLKKTKDENDRLRKEMEALRFSFEYELRQTVELSTETELRLKRRIKDLEDDIELKNSVIQDLKYDQDEKRLDQNTLEVLKARIDKLEEERASLEITNRGMTKRNEVLTQLLALSPTKTQSGFEIPTPRRRNARPMSLIIPRMPSSPGVQMPRSRPQSVLASPALGASEYFLGSLASSTSVTSSPIGMATGSPRAHDHTQSIDSGLGESCAHVTVNSGSRRSTLASHSSNSPDMHPIGHPQQDSKSQTLIRHPSKRRPRKFLPGSTQLKPLLLPTFTAENGNLPSTSPITSPNRTIAHSSRWESVSISNTVTGGCADTSFPSPSDDVSRHPGLSYQSLDEIFAKAEEPESSKKRECELRCASQAVQYLTPMQNKGLDSALNGATIQNSGSSPRISSWILDTAPPSSIDFDHVHGRGRESVNATEPQSGVDQSSTFSDFGKSYASIANDGYFARCSNENVDVPPPLFSKDRLPRIQRSQFSTHLGYDQSPLDLRKHLKTTSPYDTRPPANDIANQDISGVTASPASSRQMLTQSSALKPIGQEPIGQRPASSKGQSGAKVPLEIFQRNLGSRALATLTIQSVYATLAKYTSYIESFKRDPLALARRVIANAWRLNWTMFGKLSWWVLGLFIGHRHPVDDHGPWDWDKYDGESIADRYCVSNADGDSADDMSKQKQQEASKQAVEHGDTSTPPTSVPLSKEPKTGWGRSLFLWGKFSVAIMLAVGGAIVKGPAEMLRETEEWKKSRPNSLVGTLQETTRVSEQSFSVDNLTKEVDKWQRPYIEKFPKEDDISYGVRKGRSFSSPTPLLRPTLFDSDSTIQPVLNGDSLPDSTNQASSYQGTGPEFSSSADDTLKPIRSERKGLAFIFQAPDDEPGSDDNATLVALTGSQANDAPAREMDHPSDHG